MEACAPIFEDGAEIQHELRPHFSELAAHHSTEALRQSAIYQCLQAEIDQVVYAKEHGTFSNGVGPQPFYRVTAWNVERGIHFDGILHFLRTDPVMRHSDVLLLTETDLGMARSGNRNVARELAEALGMNYYFVPSYLNLCKGSGVEDDVEGENALGMHGNAILSRYPLTDLDMVVLPNGKDKMRGNEKRIGSQKAVVATIQFPQGPMRAVCVHLDAHSTQDHRARQMQLILDAVEETCDMPVLIGGDWNTNTYNSSKAFHAICGFWYRVALGVHNVMSNHYPYPYRKFEKGLFGALKQHGFDYDQCNVPGVCTNHFAVEDFKQYRNLRDWIPQWCFYFIEWALRPHGGRCSFKIDWFASRDLEVAAAEHALHRDDCGKAAGAQVIGDLRQHGILVSDHDAIVVDCLVK